VMGLPLPVQFRANVASNRSCPDCNVGKLRRCGLLEWHVVRTLLAKSNRHGGLFRLASCNTSLSVGKIVWIRLRRF
jgi:hypothetical protein